ncbi:metallophosphoesterase family protein [Microbulbifer sp. OS29]|uniref:Metallophosphoesterase family protein n=1 Tax=Microbulbifer okhotskensis TaxID=2926617 RepID=A0A9X2J611_9GAMM|nr:metallophosphoesterase family protein [Microbulbifer okhotskensis]MCO1336132.1 metallophosphoesterase family protein [Microbulbifer okhotskensis]
MKQLAPSLQITNEVFLCHGTPSNDLIYLLEDITRGRPRLRSVQELLGTTRAQVVLCGHPHQSRSASISSGQLIVNPGSVGLSAYADNKPNYHTMETYSAHASYAIVEQKKGGAWDVEHLNIRYDTDKAVRDAIARGRDDWGCYLSTGRAD